MNSIKKENKIIYYENKEDIKLDTFIEKKKYSIKKILKSDKRSYVALIELEGKEYIYKIPLEKNRRKWQQFLSIFRGSESQREYKNLENIRKLGLYTAIPYIAVEEKKSMMVKNSYILMSYIEAETEDIELIVDELKKIHSLGYLHGDSHRANFLIKDNKVYLIDTKLLKNIYGKFGEIFEFIYLEESYNKKLKYDKSSFYYKGAMLLKSYLLSFGKFKKIIKESLRGKK